MNGMRLEVKGLICEQPDIVFESTGSCGGDAGHGGHASVEFRMPDGGNGFVVERNPVTQSVRIMVQGDWELEGLAVALLDLGRQLMARDDVLRTWAAWRPEA